MLHKEAAASEAIRHHLEASALARLPSAPAHPPKAFASRAAIKRWMRANAPDYEGETQLVEGANAVLNIDQSLMDDGTSWLWDYAVDLFAED